VPSGERDPLEVQNLLDPRLLIVTGKGGVGKSTVAAALAVAGASTGRKTCLVEVEGRQTFSRLFSTQSWDFDEREFRPGLWGLSIDPEASLREYLEMFYGAKRLSRIVTNSSAVEFATTAAPGIKDVLLVGKVKEMERRRDSDGRFHYDLIVLDAPPTGRIVNFLRAPDATTELVNIGPIREQAQTVIDMLLDPARTHVQLVTLLEEMPVQETIESAAALQELGVTLGPVVVNRVLTQRFEPAARKAFAAMDAEQVTELAASVDLAVDAEAGQALLELGSMHLDRISLQERMRSDLTKRLHLPRVELPYIWGDHFGAEDIAALAEQIEAVL
jgi:anion-transporting  ArsA/GET3 family ATPase